MLKSLLRVTVSREKDYRGNEINEMKVETGTMDKERIF